jgi:hypothetical protein
VAPELVIERATLIRGSEHRDDAGRLTVVGHLDHGDGFTDATLARDVQFRISDASETFDVVIEPTDCQARERGAVVCATRGAPRLKLTITPSRSPSPGDYQFRLSAMRLPDAQTNPAETSLLAPLTVELIRPDSTSTDNVADCRAISRRTLVCRR